MAAHTIDEDLHSRQLAVYGRQAMGRMSATKVLISGINGLGAEIAKNVILAQVQGVTLHDTASVVLGDLGAHFYLSPADVGKNRAAACRHMLQELNPTVAVTDSAADFSKELIHAHDVVVLVGAARTVAEQVSAWCREREVPVRLIWTSINGLFGFVCNDWGDEFHVQDPTGENPRTAVIASIVDNGDETLVSCIDDERIDFEEGDVVRLMEVEGMDGIEDHDFVVKNVTKTSFKIGSTAAFPAYVSGGTVVQQKQGKTLKFAPIARAFDAYEGELLETDFAKFGRARLLMLAYQALEQWTIENGNTLPALNDVAAAKRLADIATEINAARPEDKRVDELKDSLAIVHQLALTARAVLNPMAAFFGGIVGQEVVKAASGKFHPIHQWLLVDSLESAVEGAETLEDRSEFVCKEPSRYEHQIAVFGHKVQQQLQDAKIFMVGAGALGCEFLKNFAMMGIATTDAGLVTLTDDDTIEKSNLSRQFLFRNSDVGKSKSEAAANAAHKMNGDIRLKAMTDRVSPTTEEVFGDAFWEQLSLVTNALDNVKARLYVDRRCVFYNKPLLESGTLGPKCNTQVVVPHITEHYGASRDPEEKHVPQCTLHNFPSLIDHCLSWARSEFIDHFTDRPAAAKAYIKAGGGEAYLKQLRAAGVASGELAQNIDGLTDCLGQRPTSFAECVAWGRLLFEKYFVQKVGQLIHLYPKDASTKSGMPFWSPPKRFPSTLAFSVDDPMHVGFVHAAAALRAISAGVAVPDAELRSAEHVKSLIAGVTVPAWAPKDNVKIKMDEANGGDGMDEDEPTDEESLAAAVAALPAPATLAAVALAPQEFEKDDATNFHMDFIHACANLRARNYMIKEVDALQAKLIAGKIIPAIATTTAAATGLVCLELYKLIQKKELEAYRNAFVNLALPVFQLIEPMPPAKVKSRTEKRRPDPINHPDYVEEEDIVAFPDPHTIWDHMIIDKGDITVQEFIDHFTNTHGWEVNSIAIPRLDDKGKETAAMAYSSFSGSHKSRLPEKLSVVFARLVGIDLAEYPKNYFFPSLLMENSDGAVIETPDIVFKFRK